jgi:hypothetical protein
MNICSQCHKSHDGKFKTCEPCLDHTLRRNREIGLTYYYAHQKEILEKGHIYRQVNREKENARQQRWRKENPERLKEQRQDKRFMVLQYYSRSDIPFCDCCGEKTLEFLCIDHISGNGNEHRRETKKAPIYAWLIQHNFPDGFRVLCHNCNLSLGFYGYCPHKSKEV